MLCALPIALLGVAGCTTDEPELAQTTSAATVADYASSGCSTAVVLGLSKQIADEVGCEHPGGLVRFAPTSNLQVTSSAVLPYLETDAKSDLQKVASTRVVQVNSAFRTIAQQYLLYRWYQQGRCGIAAAATVGNSNHESGRAVDLANYSSLVSAMSARGWAHDVPGDVVHFDHTASSDIRGQDVRAFQTLWNRNHPGDLISVDGSYGPQTEARLKQAPATGFAVGATCVTRAAEAADVVAVDGPDRVPPQTRAHFTITLQNGTDADWPGTLEVQAGAATPFHDDSWISAGVITTLGAAIPAGGMGQISFDVMTPPATEETPLFDQLQLSDGGQTVGTINLALTVVPDMPGPSSSDGDDQYDQEVSGGCSTTSAPGSSALALVLAAWLRRRRNYQRRQ